MVAEQRILVVRQPEVVAEIDPLLLHELELAAEIRVQNDHDHAVIAIVRRTVLDQPVWKAATENPAPVRQRRRRVERRLTKSALRGKHQPAARIGAARVRAERAPRAFEVVVVVEGHEQQLEFIQPRAFLGCRWLAAHAGLQRRHFVDELVGFSFGWKAREGRAVAPAPGELRGQRLFASGIARAFLLQIGVERCDVLMQLAVDEKRAVPREQRRTRSLRIRPGLVLMAENELSRFQRFPTFGRPRILARRFPTADHQSRILATVAEECSADAVAIAEMLLVPAVYERRRWLVVQQRATGTAMPRQLRDARRRDLGELRERPRENLLQLQVALV